jgi:dissimilatory sulfite reductase (desulfoviridin) alpha/beta subunit
LYGNRIAIGRHFLPIIFDEAKVYGIVDAALAFFEKQARPGERFCNCLDRVGWDSLQRELEALL